MSKISEKLRLYAKSIDDELKQIDIFLSRPNLDTSQVQFASGKMRAYIDILVDLEDTYPELNDREIEGDELDIRRLLEYANRIEDSVKAQTRTMLSKPIELFSEVYINRDSGKLLAYKCARKKLTDYFPELVKS